jgi:putative ATPase
MKDLGYSKGYRYAHDFEEAYVPQEYLPEALRGDVYYRPTGRGYEKILQERLEKWRKLRASVDQKEGPGKKRNKPDEGTHR